MTSKKDDPAKEAPRTGEAAGPKKPYATLDLKATEVTPKEAGATGAGSAKPGAATSSASSGPAAAGAAAGRAEPQGAASASPATGSYAVHQLEQAKLINEALQAG